MIGKKLDIESYHRELFIIALLHNNRAENITDASKLYIAAKERYYCSVAIARRVGFYSLDDDSESLNENLISLESNNKAIDGLCQTMICSTRNKNLLAKSLYLQAGLYWEFYGMGDEALINLSRVKSLFAKDHKYYRAADTFENELASYSRLFGISFVMKPL